MRTVLKQDSPSPQTLQQMSLTTLAKVLERYRTKPRAALKAAAIVLRMKP